MRSCMALGAIVLTAYDLVATPLRQPAQAASVYIAGNYGILCKERVPWMDGDIRIYPRIGLRRVPDGGSA